MTMYVGFQESYKFFAKVDNGILGPVEGKFGLILSNKKYLTPFGIIVTLKNLNIDEFDLSMRPNS